MESLKVVTDSNWGGDRGTRKSVSGGAIMWGNHFIKSWAKGQAIVALSSAEAELYAIVKATVEALGVKSALEDWNVSIPVEVLADASAALAIVERRGLGKIRHLDTRHLWIQYACARRDVKYRKVAGTVNPADLMTKTLSSEIALSHCQRLSLVWRDSRPEIAAKSV